jgi:hypothetical protein
MWAKDGSALIHANMIRVVQLVYPAKPPNYSKPSCIKLYIYVATPSTKAAPSSLVIIADHHLAPSWYQNGSFCDQILKI